ncbi:MAG: hypothetical protein JOZ14_05090 [Acidobacteria bacterium]|nr:hypothetical protein [Acidobacteriota bacterium]
MLRETIAAATRSLPIVIGASAETSTPLAEPGEPSAEVTGYSDETVSLIQSELENATGKLKFEILGLHHDNRRIPMMWSCKGPAPDSEHRNCLGIAAEAARSYAPHTLEHWNLRRFLVGSPFSSFLPPNGIPTISATNLLCGAEGTEGSDSCRGSVASELLAGRLLRGRIVIIADYSQPVVTNQIIGNVHEAALQASYIYSLLEGKIFRPIKVLPFLVIYAIWILVMQARVWRSKTLTRTFVIFCLTWLGFFLALSAMGYFLDFWKGTTGFAALAMKFVESKGHAFGHDLGGVSKGPHAE